MINVGIIGSGKSAHRYHLPYLLTLKNLYNVKTIYSPHATSTSWDKVENVLYSENLDDLMLDDKINLVIICTNQKYHYYYAKMCLEKGKNVVLEKPFTNTLEEAKELFSLAKRKNLILESYQNRLFDSDFLTLKEILDSKVLGEVYEIENNFDYYRMDQLLESNNLDKYQSFLYGHGAHTIDQMLHLFGKPDKVTYDVKSLIDGKMLDYFDVDLFYGKLKVSCRSSFLRAVARPSFVVYGTKGVYVKNGPDLQEKDLKRFYMPGSPNFGVDTEVGKLTLVTEKGVTTKDVAQVIGGYEMYYKYLYDTIVNKKEKYIKDSETLTLMEILEEGIKNV